jgi:hypothetical protein
MLRNLLQQTLIFALPLIISGAAFAAPPKSNPPDVDENECVVVLTEGQPRYSFGKLGSLESLNFGDAASTRGYVTSLFARIIIQKKRLPSAQELQAFLEQAIKKKKIKEDDIPIQLHYLLEEPESVIGPEGLYPDIKMVLTEIRTQYETLYNQLKGEILKQAFLFFRHRLKPPTLNELGAILKFEDVALLNTIVHEPGFWDEGLFSDIGRHVDYARKRIKTAYAQSVRGTYTAAVLRTRRIQPTLRRMVEVMILTKSNEHYNWRAFNGDYQEFKLFDKNHAFDPAQFEAMMSQMTGELEALLGVPGAKQNSEWVFQMPVLFPGGLQQVHDSARAENQPTFTSFEDLNKFPLENAEALRSKIETAPGILVSTIIPGLKIDWKLLNGMIKMSRDLGYPIVLIPSDGMLQDLDPIVLAHPEINILTSTIENSEVMFALAPSNFTSKPLEKFKKPGRYVIGQQIIMASHILAHEAIPTAHNTMNQTQLFTTGTVNLPEIASVGKFQKGKALQIAAEMKRSFLVAEKVDKGTGDFGGVTNHWHIRPVELRPGVEGGASVMVDNSTAYLSTSDDPNQPAVETKVVPPIAIKMPDAHFLVANPHILQAIKDYLKRMVPADHPITLVFPDPIESMAINGHVEKKQNDRTALNNLVTTGRIFYEDEINDAISNVNNIMMEFQGATLVFEYSNHSDEWIDRHMLNSPTWLQMVANGPLIDEIRTACRMNRGWTPLEYMLIHRENFLRRLAVDGSDHWKNHAVFVADPSRIRTMKLGEPLTVAASPEDNDLTWQIYLQHHGHKGANGGRSSFITHAKGEQRSATGDAHRQGFEGHGTNFWVGVGATSFEQPFTMGGYSSWGAGFAPISPYQTMQLVQYDPNSGSFFQRKEIGILAGKEFFGTDPLRVKGAMDDDERRQRNDSEEFKAWFKNQAGWLTQGRLQAPKEE